VEILDRLGELSQLEPLAAAMVVGVGRLRIAGNRLIEVGDCVLMPAKSLVDGAAQQMCLSALVVRRDRLLGELERLVGLSFCERRLGLLDQVADVLCPCRLRPGDENSPDRQKRYLAHIWPPEDVLARKCAGPIITLRRQTKSGGQAGEAGVER